jgi:hypothetical protein
MSDKKPKPIKLGDVRKAVMAAMRRNKLTSYDVWKLTGKHEADRVPRTVVHEFVGTDEPRDASISTVERIAGALGIGLTVIVTDIDKPARANAAA